MNTQVPTFTTNGRVLHRAARYDLLRPLRLGSCLQFTITGQRIRLQSGIATKPVEKIFCCLHQHVEEILSWPSQCRTPPLLQVLI